MGKSVLLCLALCGCGHTRAERGDWPETLWCGWDETCTPLAAAEVDGHELPVMFMAGLEPGERLLILARPAPTQTTEDGDVLLELTFESAAGYLPTGIEKQGKTGPWREYRRVPDGKIEPLYEEEYGEPYGKWWGGGEPK